MYTNRNCKWVLLLFNNQKFKDLFMNKAFSLTVIFFAMSFSGAAAMEPNNQGHSCQRSTHKPREERGLPYQRPGQPLPEERQRLNARRAQVDALLAQQRRDRQAAQPPRQVGNPAVQRRLDFNQGADQG